MFNYCHVQSLNIVDNFNVQLLNIVNNYNVQVPQSYVTILRNYSCAPDQAPETRSIRAIAEQRAVALTLLPNVNLCKDLPCFLDHISHRGTHITRRHFVYLPVRAQC
jgi:hypothetical protein